MVSNASAVAPLTMSDDELRVVVQRDSTDRLIAELKLAQSYFSEAEVIALSRSDLIANVMILRRLSGQTSSVRVLVSNFKPAETVEPALSDMGVGEVDVKPSVGVSADIASKLLLSV